MSFLPVSQNRLERVQKDENLLRGEVTFSQDFSAFSGLFSNRDWLPPRLTFLGTFRDPYEPDCQNHLEDGQMDLAVFRTSMKPPERHCAEKAFRKTLVNSVIPAWLAEVTETAPRPSHLDYLQNLGIRWFPGGYRI